MWSARSHDDDNPHSFINPEKELNAGLWSLFAGATILLAVRVWIKVTRRHGLWWDDYILVVSWMILTINNSLISVEYATGYVADKWDDRMHILINVTSCGTLIGQALTKTAFGVTLLKLTKGSSWMRYILWFCIVTMNGYMIAKVFLQWAKVCGKASYQNWYRLNFCIDWKFRDDFKEGGNIYNIIMDFVFALFPWILTWNLTMRKSEKIGLCATMSLGMMVAIVAAARTDWKQDNNVKDEGYFLRNAMSNIWYSSEVAGTIMVQCIPVLRPLVRDLTTSLTSERINTTNKTRHEGFSQWTGSAALTNTNYSVGCWSEADAAEKGHSGKKGHVSMEMDDIPEEELGLDPQNKKTAWKKRGSVVDIN
ncbi:hypothetical protein K504DRAFT_468513 [Pleomassaria siparia CBS 279.74]|uniref:Rhodopsin domain-containing protein n=1 Tax=Pleomassaria siparia CBS 279.74 TaxID=1314801 RepID=A0A6G1K6I7_9PLEO|nr:hypothetical protein K504DRAFT_468513 [Pleomassaria siparia CBS 279.74]